VIQEGEITVEKYAHRGASARRERHTLSLGQNKHGQNNSAPLVLVLEMLLRIFNHQTSMNNFFITQIKNSNKKTH